MASEFNIQNLFRLAFQLSRGAPFKPEAPNEDPDTSGIEFPDVNQGGVQEGQTFVEMRSVLGSNLPTGKPLFMPVQIGGLLLPNEPTLVITGQKNIVETALVGSVRKGSVKELISIEDYRLVIRGIAINYSDTKIYPEDTIKQIHDLYLKNESLEIRSALTSLIGIYRIVIKSISFPEMIGIQHAQAYELNCVSDEDFTLEIE